MCGLMEVYCFYNTKIRRMVASKYLYLINEGTLLVGL